MIAAQKKRLRYLQVRLEGKNLWMKTIRCGFYCSNLAKGTKKSKSLIFVGSHLHKPLQLQKCMSLQVKKKTADSLGCFHLLRFAAQKKTSLKQRELVGVGGLV